MTTATYETKRLTTVTMRKGTAPVAPAKRGRGRPPIQRVTPVATAPVAAHAPLLAFEILDGGDATSNMVLIDACVPRSLAVFLAALADLHKRGVLHID